MAGLVFPSGSCACRHDGAGVDRAPFSASAREAKALAREGSFVFVLILHGSIDSFIERIPAMGIDGRLSGSGLFQQDRVVVH